MAEVRAQVAAAEAAQFFETVREKCFKTCVSSKPDVTLSSGEKQCLSRCVDRYVDAMRAVAGELQRSA